MNIYTFQNLCCNNIESENINVNNNTDDACVNQNYKITILSPLILQR